MIHTLTTKQLLELKFWLTDDLEAERVKLRRYIEVFGLRDGLTGEVLEIGTGPLWGLLPFVRSPRPYRQTGIDPLYPAFEDVGILEDRGGVQRIDQPFELWDTNETFDHILTTNALDHGEMGFYLIPKIWRMLKPGGRFYMHVHLRPPDLLNLVHDHCLTEAQLDKQLGFTNLKKIVRQVYKDDVDGGFCPALVGIWGKPIA